MKTGITANNSVLDSLISCHKHLSFIYINIFMLLRCPQYYNLRYNTRTILCKLLV